MKESTQDKMYMFSPKFTQVSWLVFSLKILM